MLVLSTTLLLFALTTIAVAALDGSNRWHVKTTAAYSGDGTLSIESPSTRGRHHLFLFLSRSNAIAPFRLENAGWTRLGECVKSKNRQRKCWLAKDCVRYSRDSNFKRNSYCEKFPDGSPGIDLSTAVFYKKARRSEPSYEFALKGSAPSWAVLVAVDAGVNAMQPVRDIATNGCDKIPQSAFPSVGGNKGDILLLSMAFDDYFPLRRKKFEAPPGTSILGFAPGDADMGYVYGGTLEQTGETGVLTTVGDGGSKCKDALIAIALRVD